MTPIGPAEGHPRLGVVGGQLEAGLRAADREGRDGDPAVVQGLEELLEAPALLAEQVLERDAAVVEAETVRVGDVPAELVVSGLHGEPRRARRDHDRGDLCGAVLVGARPRGHGHDGRDVGARVGDERLGTVDDPLVAVQGGPRLGCGRVRAGLGLREAEAGKGLSGHEVGQEAQLLLVVAVGEDRVDAEPDARGQGDPDGLVDPAELLDGHAEAGEVALSVVGAAAVLLRHDETEEAELAHLGDQVGREVALRVPLRDVGCDLLLGEVPDDLAEVLVLLAQLEHGQLLDQYLTLT